ncbi:TRAP transporter small permease [Bordetella petrii]|uniref:TRAP transporter small permease n=1 Tax=Bordetella petrii TaxID=94624 RepID=UPI001E48E1BD|nr:TRAP transporter small permease [Bordetella petrii]MCD0504070.1 TRAP transporter small permease [Bordetella petrii]
MTSDRLRDKGLLLLGAVALASTLIGVLAVVSRYAFTMAFSFSDEVITYLIVWATLIAFGLGEFWNEHLRATVLLERLPPAWQAALSKVTLALALAFAGVLVYFGVDVAWQRYLLNELSPTALRFPQWIARMAVPAGFAIACIALLVRARRK